MSNLVDIGVSCRVSEPNQNPWLDRLLKSLETVSAGMIADVYIEKGEELTKVEKRIRIFRRSKARYLIVCEDDTQVIHDGWLVNLICRMSAMPNIAIMNPAETRHEPEQVPEDALNDVTQELAYCCGFCMCIDRESGIEPDVRVQTLDDLWLSLAARAKGWRCARTEAVIVRHSKQPWASDDVDPSSQPDRRRFGEGSDYYNTSKHERKRQHEAKLMIETFGDLARMTLPKHLIADQRIDPLYAGPSHEERFKTAVDNGVKKALERSNYSDKPVTRQEALSISTGILERAERERLEVVHREFGGCE